MSTVASALVWLGMLTQHGDVGTSYCVPMQVTGYLRTAGASHTFDGTPIATPESIVAASYDIPLQSLVSVEDLGVYRVADRGMLGSAGWIDIAVWTLAEAYAVTSRRTVCVTPPEGRLQP